MKILLKPFFRGFLINFIALIITAGVIPGISYSGGYKTLALAAVVFMAINLLVVPVLKIMFLPLNLLTLGFFAWAVNVVAFYFLTALIPQFKLTPYSFSGFEYHGFIFPNMDLNVWQVAILASFLIGFISHFIQWLIM